ncbi:hypothetical protein JXJ21_06350 [candidate division KSB1 bacterium]|nr:hypothetical protein [candidate division KSB1 bacterium]
MKDEYKNKTQLIDELNELRRQVAELESGKARQEQAEQLLQTQHDLGLALIAAGSLEEKFKRCVDSAINASEMDCGGIYLVDEHTGELNLACHQGLSAKFIKQVSHYKADAPNAKLVQAGQPVYGNYQLLAKKLGG